MSILRENRKSLLRSVSHLGATFKASQKSQVIFCEDACDMPTLIDRAKRGSNPSVRVAEYSSMICNDNEKLLSNPPAIINDPTDVDMSELHQKVDVNPDEEITKTE